jgi:hypothetical protein
LVDNCVFCHDVPSVLSPIALLTLEACQFIPIASPQRAHTIIFSYTGDLLIIKTLFIMDFGAGLIEYSMVKVK